MFPSLPPEPYVKHCLVYLLLHLTSIDQVSPYCLVPGGEDADMNKPDPCPQDSGYLGGNLPFLRRCPFPIENSGDVGSGFGLSDNTIRKCPC